MADQNAANCIRDCRDNAIFLCGARQPRVEAGKSFTVWQLCIFFATPQRLRKIKINCLLLNLLSKFYLHLNAFQRLDTALFSGLTFATHCCHFNSAAFSSSRKMQWMRLHKWLSGVYRRLRESNFRNSCTIETFKQRSKLWILHLLNVCACVKAPAATTAQQKSLISRRSECMKSRS